MHPFQYTNFGRSYRVNLKQGDGVRAILFKEEVEYYSKFFDSVRIIDGVFSEHSVKHPLYKESLKCYKERNRHKISGDSLMDSFYKLALQLMYSSTNQRRYRKKLFSSVVDAAVFVSDEYNLSIKDFDNFTIKQLFKSKKYFTLRRVGNQFELIYVDINSDSNIHSLSSRIVSEALLRVVKMLEIFSDNPLLEICYVNTDSFHLSMPSSYVESFFDCYKEYIHGDIGGLKVQAIADKGYWLDVGRYWLVSGEKVLMFANSGFNSKVKPTIFSDMGLRFFRRSFSGFFTQVVYDYICINL